MIVGKLWKAFSAQMNKMANFLWKADPVAQLQYEYDKAGRAFPGFPAGMHAP